MSIEVSFDLFKKMAGSSMSEQCGIDPSMVWHDIESNKEHLKRNGEHYVADATLFSENMNLRRENESLKMENDELRELVCRIWNAARLMQANEHITGMRITDEFRSECEAKFAKLGIDVDEPWETMEDDE